METRVRAAVVDCALLAVSQRVSHVGRLRLKSWRRTRSERVQQELPCLAKRGLNVDITVKVCGQDELEGGEETSVPAVITPGARLIGLGLCT